MNNDIALQQATSHPPTQYKANSPSARHIARWLLSGLVILLGTPYKALSDPLFYGISEDISDIPTVSSSKREEDLFKSPLSTSVVTAEQIKQAGILSVPEALKLVPGVIVREQTNGQFEVHIRGLENVPTGGGTDTLSNRLSLVMIDNRTVYNYFDGGLFWETLPVGIDDISRIEIIRGAASALYGPNAVNGVIHIITKRAQDKSAVSVNLTTGSHDTQIAHIAAEQPIGDARIRISGFVNQRDRYQSTYYSYSQEEYVPLALIPTTNSRFPDPDEAQDLHAVTVAVNNDPLELLAYDLSYSHQDSRVQKVHLGSRATPLTFNDSTTDAINAKVRYGDLELRASHEWGEQKTLDYTDFTYNLAVSQASAEYQFRLPKWIIRPGISYENIAYEGSFIGGKQTIKDVGYLLRTEYFPAKDYRLIVALRLDDYNVPDEKYFSYQVLGTYQLRHDTLLRAALQTANRSPFMLDSFVNLKYTLPSNPSIRLDYLGDEEAELVTTTTYELGLRHQFNFNNWIDLELFRSELNDFTEFVDHDTVFDGSQFVTTSQLEMLPTKAQQTGITASWNYEELTWDMSLFMTTQKTHVDNQYVDSAAPLVLFNTDNKGTPDYYGGVNLNWHPVKRWSLNANAYYMSSHRFIIRPQGTKNFASAVYANFTLSHTFNKAINGFVSVKNLSNKNDSQYFYTDSIEPLYAIGVSLKWSE
ncbi:TonB-dependent receptor plug domain-containing protein [Alkalimarinus alittae]|uniref:TonB-dependent receptor plug domain-containing protein n=1 Tax=Alkalimarinus alittae TaxID=2961619 RepID=A0ABY6N1P0_9ALTE|nr:TonB-dependent receptor plug domain-containing protein [Alkalimarinus alittae]UZE96028.1 TonB-dependent receptor plug domain-containing protein [Alkalimarinus alittae]